PHPVLRTPLSLIRRGEVEVYYIVLLPITNYQLPIPNPQLPITHYQNLYSGIKIKYLTIRYIYGVVESRLTKCVFGDGFLFL
ncbi:MAG: hypothetical protein SWZ49_07290, partial [Cyanobacteriota bacterium]|nr:hypothetical protein [Cyanobacteriota bacterium]